MQIVPQGTQLCATQNQTVPLFVTGRPNPVAYFATQTRTLQKGIDFTKHIVRQPRAIAFDADVLAQAEKLGAQHIQVKDITTNDIWTITFADFRRYQFSVNRGFGLQYAAALDHWSRNGEQSEYNRRAEAKAAAVEQLALFDTGAGWREVYR